MASSGKPRGPEVARRGGCGSVERRRRWRMWATHSLTVALALSVLPGSWALRQGDCEGAGSRGPRSVADLPNHRVGGSGDRSFVVRGGRA